MKIQPTKHVEHFTICNIPGGVREVFHRKGEAYQIFWPEKTDFVRLAAKFNATIVPLTIPKPFPARHYFLFGKPYDTSSLDPKNQDACRDVYKAIENEVTQDIAALLEARKDDPYALDGIKRTSYQRLFGKDPPTFPMESLKSSVRKA